MEWGGFYQDIKRGIPRGSSLSPLLGTFYLMDLDQKMQTLGVRYFWYMDDILILAPTRWKLRKAIRVLNQTFNELKLEKHPEKTLIGKVEGGFDFQIGDYFSLRLGAATNPNRISGGFGINYDGIQFDYGLRTHPVLSETHVFNISYVLK